MHISEGILPPLHAALWGAAAAPFLGYGLWSVRRRVAAQPDQKPFIALVGAAVFIVSCMPVPVPWAGTCSHPCGTGMAALLIGAGPTVVVAFISLLLQALFLAHGGLTTLGINLLGMGVAGPLAAVGVFRLLRACGVGAIPAAFVAGLLSDWATYAVTAAGLGLLAPEGASALRQGLLVAAAFAPTQVPLGVAEGVVTAAAWRFLHLRRPELLAHLAGAARVLLLAATLGAGSLMAAEGAPAEAPATWSGVDETVVAKVAEASGRPARDPYINTDQGDLLLFLFLLAGSAGGFVAGWTARGLFGGKRAA